VYIGTAAKVAAQLATGLTGDCAVGVARVADRTKAIWAVFAALTA